MEGGGMVRIDLPRVREGSRYLQTHNELSRSIECGEFLDYLTTG
jgi:hypothetical protein